MLWFWIVLGSIVVMLAVLEIRSWKRPERVGSGFSPSGSTTAYGYDGDSAPYLTRPSKTGPEDSGADQDR